MEKHLNILIAPINDDGCSSYRIKNPYKAMKSEEVDVLFIDNKTSGEDLLSLVGGADIIVFRQQHYKLMKMIIDKQLSQAKLVVDFDDDIFNMCPYTDAYRVFGLEEVTHEGKKLWEDGKNGFDIAKNKAEADRSVEMIKNADLVTVTTDYLADVMKEIGAKETAVLDNAIDLKHWKKWDLKKKKEIRIGWTGGATHYIDWYTIKDSLKNVFDKYKDSDYKLRLVIQGCKWDGVLKGINYEYHDWIAFEGHPYKTASLDLDIAIIPLDSTKFNESKSCIKWYEFSALGVPSVVANVLPYSEEIEHNTSMPYSTPDGFEEQLCTLIEDKILRQDIGDSAREYVKKNKSLKDMAKLYTKTLWKLKKKKSLLI